MERVNRNWSVRLRPTVVHLQRVCHEVVYGWVDRCSVCHADLRGYQDGRCVSCNNIGVCQACVQFYDPKYHDIKGDIIATFPYDGSAAAKGDAVCLQCAVVSDIGTHRQQLLLGMYRAADAVDALLGDGDFSPKNTLLRLYFNLWKRWKGGKPQKSSKRSTTAGRRRAMRWAYCMPFFDIRIHRQQLLLGINRAAHAVDASLG